MLPGVFYCDNKQAKVMRLTGRLMNEFGSQADE